LRGDSFLRFASLAVPGFDVCDDELFVTFQVADSVYVPMPQSVTERLFDMAPTRIQRSVEPVSVRVGESIRGRLIRGSGRLLAVACPATVCE
jgi:hypothetical protein